jgi:hypothetical protein
MAEDAGLEMQYHEERLNDIRTHYDKLASYLAKPISGLDAEALASISRSISRWQAALLNGDITWACFIARKPA